MSDYGLQYIDMLEIGKAFPRHIQTVITFDSDVQLRVIIYQDAQNLNKKPQENTNGHNFLLGCLIAAHTVSRRSKFKTEAPRKFKRS